MKKTKSQPIVDKYYMVFVEGRGEPKKVHCNYNEAYAEANRLALKEPNRLVRILLIEKQIRGEVNPVEVPIVVLPKDWGKVNGDVF